MGQISVLPRSPDSPPSDGGDGPQMTTTLAQPTSEIVRSKRPRSGPTLRAHGFVCRQKLPQFSAAGRCRFRRIDRARVRRVCVGLRTAQTVRDIVCAWSRGDRITRQRIFATRSRRMNGSDGLHREIHLRSSAGMLLSEQRTAPPEAFLKDRILRSIVQQPFRESCPNITQIRRINARASWLIMVRCATCRDPKAARKKIYGLFIKKLRAGAPGMRCARYATPRRPR
jgi:hypothetical protein